MEPLTFRLRDGRQEQGAKSRVCKYQSVTQHPLRVFPSWVKRSCVTIEMRPCDPMANGAEESVQAFYVSCRIDFGSLSDGLLRQGRHSAHHRGKTGSSPACGQWRQAYPTENCPDFPSHSPHAVPHCPWLPSFHGTPRVSGPAPPARFSCPCRTAP